MLRSKYSFNQYYATMGILTIFFIACIVSILSAGKKSYGDHAGIPASAVHAAEIFAVFILYCYYFLWKIIPRITITLEGLTLRFPWSKKKIYWDEVESIRLTGSEKMRFLIASQYMEATTIETKAGEKIPLFEGFYRNMRSLRIVLERASVLKEQGKSVAANLDFSISDKPEETDITTEETVDVFSDSFITSNNGIMFFGSIAGLIVMLFYCRESLLSAAMLVLCFILLLYFFLGIQSYYFLVSGTHLIIQNHLFRWYRKVYALEDILEVHLEFAPKRSTALRINTKDFTSKAYCAGSLRNKTWKGLFNRLEKAGIGVPK